MVAENVAAAAAVAAGVLRWPSPRRGKISGQPAELAVHDKTVAESELQLLGRKADDGGIHSTWFHRHAYGHTSGNGPYPHKRSSHTCISNPRRFVGGLVLWMARVEAASVAEFLAVATRPHVAFYWWHLFWAYWRARRAGN